MHPQESPWSRALHGPWGDWGSQLKNSGEWCNITLIPSGLGAMACRMRAWSISAPSSRCFNACSYKQLGMHGRLHGCFAFSMEDQQCHATPAEL